MSYICLMTDTVSVGSYSFNNDGCMPTVGAATPKVQLELSTIDTLLHAYRRCRDTRS